MGGHHKHTGSRVSLGTLESGDEGEEDNNGSFISSKGKKNQRRRKHSSMIFLGSNEQNRGRF